METSHCMYCGSVVMIDADNDLSEEAKVNQATMECDCQLAEEARMKVYEKKNAKDRIQELFGPSCQRLDLRPIPNVSIHRLLEKIVDMLVEGDIFSVTMDIDAETKAKVSISAKGKISIERERKIKYKLEA